MECELAEVTSTDSFYAIVGRIVNTAAEEAVLSENGKVDPVRLNALINSSMAIMFLASRWARPGMKVQAW